MGLSVWKGIKGTATVMLINSLISGVSCHRLSYSSVDKYLVMAKLLVEIVGLRYTL